MFDKRLRHHPKDVMRKLGRSAGSALIIVLSAMTIVCVLVVALIAQANLNRQISFSSAGMYRAKMVGQLGVDVIVGDLRDEIAAGSVTTSSNGVTIYTPTTNFTAVPFRTSTNSFANLIKQSLGGVAFWSGTNFTANSAGPIRAFAGNSTTNNSANGRSIGFEGWNATYLLETSSSTNWIGPDWILVTRSGVQTNAVASPPAMSSLSDENDESNYVIGRFAYMIYNEGGLLDVNVAGAPDNVPADFKTRRGTLAQIDLTAIPGISDAQALIDWRNSATAELPSTYTNFVLHNTNGFRKVEPGDQAFVSRRDLIKFVKNHPASISTNALQYLGTFSRELNAPTYTPPSVRAKTASGRGYRASGAGDMDDQFNPSLINTRVINAFTRNDGSTANIGEPLVKSRFPLSRLALLTRAATATTSDPIFKYFGLSRASTSESWNYRNGADRIKRLDEVASEGRDPDFFELLQAAILIGSLGQNASNVNMNVTDYDQNTYYQIMQIGANIIDQYDQDSYPTLLSFNATEFPGVENIPYLNRVFTTIYRFNNPPNHPVLGIWYQPEIWNPSAQAGTPPTAPIRFRFITTGRALGQIQGGTSPAAINSPITDFASTKGLEFTTSSSPSFFSVPGILSPAMVNAALLDPNDAVNDGTTSFVGIQAARWTAPDKNFASTAPYTYSSVRAIGQAYVTHNLQFWDDLKGDWVTYSQAKNIKDHGDMYPGTNLATHNPILHASHSDPRSDRFGIFIRGARPLPLVAGNYSANYTIRPDAGPGEVQQAKDSPNWTFVGGIAAAYSGLLSENKSTSAVRYTDPDGVQRRADGAFANGSLASGGYPLATDAFESRPLVLNRPFRSVAELGYASRGMPWKHLDFFTQESADSALLDLFCLNESPQDAVEAGRVDLNTGQPKVLEAIIAGAIKSDEGATSVVNTDAANLAQAMSDATKGPLLNRSELVTRWLGDTAIFAADSKDTIIKRRREAAVRALAGVGNTRTWNLLIDVIAQSGKYPRNASDLNEFVVEGERRFWVHIALDRYTGKIIDQYWESVSE